MTEFIRTRVSEEPEAPRPSAWADYMTERHGRDPRVSAIQHRLAACSPGGYVALNEAECKALLAEHDGMMMRLFGRDAIGPCSFHAEVDGETYYCVGYLPHDRHTLRPAR